jgi:hypothetical protein
MSSLGWFSSAYDLSPYKKRRCVYREKITRRHREKAYLHVKRSGLRRHNPAPLYPSEL